MSELIFLWLLGALTCGSTLSIWFDSDFPCIVTKWARALGWNRQGPWPDDIEYRHWLRFQWQRWSEDSLWPWLHHMLNCPRCFSCHVAYVVGLGITLSTGHWPWALLFTTSYPVAGQLLYGLAKKTLTPLQPKSRDE